MLSTPKNGSESATVATWGNWFTFTWRSGDSLTVRLVAVGALSNYNDAARMSESGPLAILKLCGRSTLSVTPDWSGYFAGEPFVEFYVEGVSAADRTTVLDYVQPGEKW